MDKPWFDAHTGDLLFDDYVADLPSFKRVTSDAVITEAELEEQQQRVQELFRRLERKLPPEVRDIATDALCELAVLVELQLQSSALPNAGKSQ